MRRRDIEVAKLAMSLREHEINVRKAAAAVTLTEMYFRPLPARALEYLYVFVLLLFHRDYLHVSVGISQVSLRHIYRSQGKTGLALLSLAMNPRKILNECCLVIGTFDQLSVPSMAKEYNGNSTYFYRRLLEKNLQNVESIWSKLET